MAIEGFSPPSPPPYYQLLERNSPRLGRVKNKDIAIFSGKLIEVYLVVFPIEVSLSAESVSNPKHFFTNSCLDSFGDGFSSSKRGVEAFLAIG